MVLAPESVQAALTKVQASVNQQLERQFRQLVSSLHDFLDDLFNHPPERPWPMTLARFTAHWEARGLRLSSPTVRSLERLIEDRLGPAVGDQFAEGPAAFPELPPLNSDAISPYVSAPATAEHKFDGRMSFYAKWHASRVRLAFGLTEEEGIRLEFYYNDQYQRIREGRPQLPEPLFLIEARQRYQQGPSFRAMTDEEVKESIRREQAERYWELSPEERRKLDLEWEREARRKFAAEHGGFLGFLNPGLPGNFDDLMASLGSVAGAGMANRQLPLPLASEARNRRAPRGKYKPPPSPPKKPPKRKDDDKDREETRHKPKPEFPPPVDPQRYPIRPDGSFAKNLQLAAESEAAMAHLLHSLPNLVVIYWGQKQGMQGADIITFNLRTKQVTLWDVKYRTSAVRLQPSRTFQQGTPARGSALQQAMDAVDTSSLSNADKAHAISAIKAGSIQTITVGAGNAKNSTVGD